MTKFKYLLVLCSFLLTSVLFVEKANAMGFIDSIRVCMFSEIEGVLTKDGAPMAGVEVVRLADYRGTTKTQSITTDHNGRFYFDSIFTWSLAGIMADVRVFQDVTAKVNGREVKLWDTVKYKGGYLSELGLDVKQGQKKLSVTCELNDADKVKLIRTEHRLIGVSGICRWDGDVLDEEYPEDKLD